MKEQNAKEELHLLLCHKQELIKRNSMSYELDTRIQVLRKFLDSLNDEEKKVTKKVTMNNKESEGPF